jgi:hypothetical protein
MRVFSTLMPRSNENKSCMRVDESWEARVRMRVFSTLMPRSNENKSCMIVDESWEARVRMRVFSTLMPRSNRRTRVAWELMRVEKREFAWEFSQLSCPGQTGEQELHESWWELRSESSHESFLNSHAPVKPENKSCMRVDESWEARVCMRVFVTVMRRSNENKSCTRIDENRLDITARA